MGSVPVLRTWAPGELATAAMLNNNVRDPAVFYKQRPMFLARNLGNQSLTNSTWTAVTWGLGTLVDSENMYPGSGSDITIVRPGLYDIRAQGFFAANTNGGRALGVDLVRANGTPVYGICSTGMISSCSNDFPGFHTYETTVRLGDLGYYFGAGDKIKLMACQTSGGNLDLVGDSTNNFTWICVRWVAAS